MQLMDVVVYRNGSGYAPGFLLGWNGSVGTLGVFRGAGFEVMQSVGWGTGVGQFQLASAVQHGLIIERPAAPAPAPQAAPEAPAPTETAVAEPEPAPEPARPKRR